MVAQARTGIEECARIASDALMFGLLPAASVEKLRAALAIHDAEQGAPRRKGWTR